MGISIVALVQDVARQKGVTFTHDLLVNMRTRLRVAGYSTNDVVKEAEVVIRDIISSTLEAQKRSASMRTASTVTVNANCSRCGSNCEMSSLENGKEVTYCPNCRITRPING
jgi:formamidopyrimidine-DNA glycosylase